MNTPREHGFTPEPPKRFRKQERSPRDYAHPSESVLPTEHLRRAYASIDAATGNKDAGIAQKRAFIVDIRTDGLLDEAIMQRHPVVYAGSDKDIHYPLCLGARTIMMVDPIFEDPKQRIEVEARIAAIITHQPEWIGDGLEFKFDFGKGDEDVLVTFHPDLFLSEDGYAATQEQSDEAVGVRHVVEQIEADPNTIFISDAVKEEYRTKTGRFAPGYRPKKRSIPQRFEMPLTVGMIMGYRTTGIDFDQDPAVLAALVPGGYLLSDHAFASISASLSSEELQDMLLAKIDGKSGEILRKKWLERGFTFIPLASQGDSDQYTFVHKQVS